MQRCTCHLVTDDGTKPPFFFLFKQYPPALTVCGANAHKMAFRRRRRTRKIEDETHKGGVHSLNHFHSLLHSLICANSRLSCSTFFYGGNEYQVKRRVFQLFVVGILFPPNENTHTKGNEPFLFHRNCLFFFLFCFR